VNQPRRLGRKVERRVRDERHEGSGPSDGDALPARETFVGSCAGGERGTGRPLRSHADPQQNPANPRSGTGLQHARTPCVEETVEVVRNHVGGTSVVVAPRRRTVAKVAGEWTHTGSSEEGNPGEGRSHGRKDPRGRIRLDPGRAGGEVRCGGGRNERKRSATTLRRVSVKPRR
jgi:hypothetical protein